MISLRVLDTFAVLICVMIVVLIAMAILNRGSHHEAGPIAAMAGSLAAVSASRANLARGGPPLDPATRARRRKRVGIVMLVAVGCAIVGAAAAVLLSR